MTPEDAVKEMDSHFAKHFHGAVTTLAWHAIKEELENPTPFLSVTLPFPECPVCGEQKRFRWEQEGNAVIDGTYQEYCHNCERLDSTWPCELGGW